MDTWKIKLATSTIGAIALIAAVWIASHSFVYRNERPRTISVKGMASRSFTSDFVVWSCAINQKAPTPQEGMKIIERQRNEVLEYLRSKGIQDSEIETSPVSYSENTSSFWDNGSDRYITIKDGYNISVTIKISSESIDRVEAVAQSIGDLLGQGIMIDSYSPLYYYTKLADLKLEMLGEAASDARSRAEQIAKESNAVVGKLKSSSMGVFQILGKYSSEEEYSWGGTFNTSSKEKTATITVSSIFSLK